MVKCDALDGVPLDHRPYIFVAPLNFSKIYCEIESPATPRNINFTFQYD